MTPETSSSNAIPRRDFIKRVGQATAATAILAESLPAIAQDHPAISVAFVGAAHIHAPNYLKILKNRPDVKVKCVWDHDAPRAKKFADELGCATVNDVKAVWSDPEIKAIVICSETNRHRDLVLAAAAAGKHMFVEKPLGANAADSQAMAAAIDKAKVIFTTGYFMRTDPAILFLKDQVTRGNFGIVTRVRGSFCHNGALGDWFRDDLRWMADPKIAGVGAFGDLGTHPLDVLMWMFGDVDAITADIKVVTKTYGDCDESGEALIKFKSGVTGTVAAGWVDVDNPVTFLISGTEGHAFVLQNTMVFFKSSKVSGADGRRPWTDLPEHSPLPLDQFVNAVTGKTAMPLVTPQEAAARVTVVEAAYKAAQSQTWAKVG